MKLLGIALFEGWCFGLGPILAQTEPISGGAGWIGAGLLGLVLAWVFGKQIPDERKDKRDLLTAKDAQITALIESRDKLAENMSANAAQAVMAVSRDNKESITALIETTEKRHQENLDGQRLERSERQSQFNILLEEHQKSHADAKEGRHKTAEVLGVLKNWLAVFRHLVPGIKGLEDESPLDPPETTREQRPGR